MFDSNYKTSLPSANILAVIVLLLVGISVLRWLGDGKNDEQNATQPQIEQNAHQPQTQPVNSAVDPRGAVIDEAKKTARENYVNKMQDEFRNSGVEATISDLDGEMTIVSDVLKLKPDRDQLMRSTFDPAYRRGLCVAGFRTVKLTSGILFGDGDTYSLGCPETKEERQARTEAQRGQRQVFVDELQKSFNSDSGIAALDIRVEQGTNELILTSASVKDVPPKMFQSMFAAGFGDVSSNNLCGVGFRGLRVRSSPNSSGTFLSFNCGKTSH